MVKIAYQIFYISLMMYVVINIAYYFLGNYLLAFLSIDSENLNILHNITFLLIISLGSVALVEIFYRYFLGSNQLTRAFLLKLVVPILGIILFLILNGVELIYRFIYAYGISLVISAFLIAISFTVDDKYKKNTVKV